jgi:uncharacterized protein (DUF1786 family)
VRILAIDIGTGTQDVLLWESGVAVENLVQVNDRRLNGAACPETWMSPR